MVFHSNVRLLPEILSIVDAFISNYQLKQQHFLTKHLIVPYEIIFSRYEIMKS